MNVLFVLYGDLGSNSAVPLGLHARELEAAGHRCAVAVTKHRDDAEVAACPAGRVFTYQEALDRPHELFPDGRPADVVHAWTPRENVRRFVTAWLARHPAPLVMYLEDNEDWIARQVLAAGSPDALLSLHDEEIAARLPAGLSHPFRFADFIGLADAAVVLQEKLGADVPPWVPCETVLPGVDLELFAPRAPQPASRRQYGVAPGERVIVYPGGLNSHTRPGLEALCRAVGLLNAEGRRCRLLRSGPFPLDFLDRLPEVARNAVSDLGVLPRERLPGLMALADVLVQPGAPGPFEDLRLPGKLPEFLAMGKPVVLPDAGIAHRLAEGDEILLTRTGSAEEIADKCRQVFDDPALARRLGEGARRFAEAAFDPRRQAAGLLAVYERALAGFDAHAARSLWAGAQADTPPAQLLQERLAVLATAAASPQVASLLRAYRALHLQARQRIAALQSDIAARELREARERNEELARDADALRVTLRERDAAVLRLQHVADQYAHALGHGDANAAGAGPRLLRYASTRARQAMGMARRVRTMVQQKGGARGFAAAAWRIAANEGWGGVRRRTAWLYAPHRSAVARLDPETPADRLDYAEWVRRYDQPTAESRAHLRAQAAALPVRPLISILMPTYNSQPRWLEAAIASVQAQVYEHWELCIADDASTRPEVGEILARHAAADPRIKVRVLERNGHISAASNAALELATGEWIALLDHDDLLADGALFWVADAIARHPEVRLIYSDEDKIGPDGKRTTPYFKCDWNADLFTTHNLVTHLGVYHAPLVRQVGGFTVGLEGAQDWDLAMRCVEQVTPAQIHHIPRILYHWRMHGESTAQSPEAKPYAAAAGLRALQQHLQRRGVDATVSQTPAGLRVHYALPAQPPLVSLVIPTRNGLRLLRRCVDSILRKTRYPHYEIIVVDNGSDDPATLKYLDKLRAQANCRVVRDERPFNYSALNNAAVAAAAGEVVGLLNNDLEVIAPDWLSEMVALSLQPGVGVVGARLLYPNGVLQHAGVVLGVGGIAGHAHKNLPRKAYGYFGRACSLQSFSAVTAACLVTRKAVYQQVGGLDEDLAVAFNDVDFCLRVRAAGYRNVWTPYAELYHHESATRGLDDTAEKQARFAREVQTMNERWGEQLRQDPAYSPNLTLSFEDFSLAWPPRLPAASASPRRAPLAEAAPQHG